MTSKDNNSNISHVYLYDYLKKNINLGDFLETEIGADLKWKNDNMSASLICPMPHHKDAKSSFCIKLDEDSGVWIYQCWGCGSKGTILDFCMDYYELQGLSDVVEMLCKKFKFKDAKDIVISSLKSLKKKINVQKRMEYQNIVISNQCRAMLKKDFEGNSTFVSKTYRELNEALNEEDMDRIQEIDNLVFNKMQEGM